MPKEGEKGAPLDGNKVNIDFQIFLCSVLTEKLENNLNANGNVTLETKLAKVDKKADLDYIVGKHYKMIGFKSKPYRMRNFGSRALKLIETRHNDHKLKE